MDDSDHTGRHLKIDDLLSDIEDEIYKTEQTIRIRAAIEYMIGLVDEAYREKFKAAEEQASTIEDLKKILVSIKRHIGQEAAIGYLEF